MTEFDVIDRFFNRSPARQAALGIGDDGALINGTTNGRAVVCDTMLAGRHFYPDVDPESLGHKALAVNFSDLAAMGAKPECFLLALTLPNIDELWLEQFARGLFGLADRFDCELIGGDTTSGPLSITITAIGQVETRVALRRDAAEPGDDVWISGQLGAAAIAVQLLARESDPPAYAVLDRISRQQAEQALTRPQPRVELGMALRHFARTAIDISDGLIADLNHLAARSRVGLHINVDDVPVAPCLKALDPSMALQAALNGGDDYELAFTAAPENQPAIDQIGLQLGLALTRIGEVRVGEGVRLTDSLKRPVKETRKGFDHFGPGR